jgi:hypothetical protein
MLVDTGRFKPLTFTSVGMNFEAPTRPDGFAVCALDPSLKGYVCRGTDQVAIKIIFINILNKLFNVIY